VFHRTDATVPRVHSAQCPARKPRLHRSVPKSDHFIASPAYGLSARYAALVLCAHSRPHKDRQTVRPRCVQRMTAARATCHEETRSG
jgi:hypothetical protein